MLAAFLRIPSDHRVREAADGYAAAQPPICVKIFDPVAVGNPLNGARGKRAFGLDRD